MTHQEDQALLKAYITEWRKFFTQCNYLPTPFRQLENTLAGKSSSAKRVEKDSIVRKVKYFNFECINTKFSKNCISLKKERYK